jgi:hypothetical protein
MWEETFHINETLAIVCDLIGKAEENLREHIRIYYQNAGEEFITNLFYGQISYFLSEANKERLIENAFIKDLKNALGYNHFGDYTLSRNLKNTAAGLVADIVLHNKKTEGRTGGDFGLIIIHPSIQFDSRFLKIKKGQCSGLLCQAKLKDKAGKWNRLTKNQRVTLDQNKDFSSFVLYSYVDIKRINLNFISWALCRNEDIANIEEIMKRDALDELTMFDTKKILQLLGRKEIGTNDNEAIKKIISPSVRQHFEIRIYWPNSDDDSDTLKIKIKHFQKAKQIVKVYQG